MVALALSAFFLATGGLAFFALAASWRKYAGQFMALRRELALESESEIYVIGDIGPLRAPRGAWAPVRGRVVTAGQCRPAQRVAA